MQLKRCLHLSSWMNAGPTQKTFGVWRLLVSQRGAETLAHAASAGGQNRRVFLLKPGSSIIMLQCMFRVMLRFVLPRCQWSLWQRATGCASVSWAVGAVQGLSACSYLGTKTRSLAAESSSLYKKQQVKHVINCKAPTATGSRAQLDPLDQASWRQSACWRKQHPVLL